MQTEALEEHSAAEARNAHRLREPRGLLGGRLVVATPLITARPVITAGRRLGRLCGGGRTLCERERRVLIVRRRHVEEGAAEAYERGHQMVPSARGRRANGAEEQGRRLERRDLARHLSRPRRCRRPLRELEGALDEADDDRDRGRLEGGDAREGEEQRQREGAQRELPLLDEREERLAELCVLLDGKLDVEDRSAHDWTELLEVALRGDDLVIALLRLLEQTLKVTVERTEHARLAAASEQQQLVGERRQLLGVYL